MTSPEDLFLINQAQQRFELTHPNVKSAHERQLYQNPQESSRVEIILSDNVSKVFDDLATRIRDLNKGVDELDHELAQHFIDHKLNRAHNRKETLQPKKTLAAYAAQGRHATHTPPKKPLNPQAAHILKARIFANAREETRKEQAIRLIRNRRRVKEPAKKPPKAKPESKGSEGGARIETACFDKIKPGEVDEEELDEKSKLILENVKRRK